MQTKRKLVDIPELVERLRDEKSRQKDYLADQGSMEVSVATNIVVGADKQPKEVPEFRLSLGNGVNVGVLDQAHGQIAGKLDIPKRYYDRMLKGIKEDVDLLADNVNHWLEKQGKKRRLIRTIDGLTRAYLGSRYRPLSHLDVVTQAVMVVTGQEPDSHDQPWAKGARCFSWALNPMKLDVEFVNPCITVDLNHLDQGFKIEDFKHDKDNGGGGTGFVYAGHGIQESSNGAQGGWWHKPGTLRVMPTVRISNSETGHGGLTVTAGLYEAICDNTSHIGQSLAQIHIGGELKEDELWSPETQQKINAVIFSKVRDVTRNAFNPELLLTWAKRFKGLEEVQVHNVKEAVGHVIELGGLNEDLRDDILAAYHGMTEARGNLFDLQRAVTGTAHVIREKDADIAGKLEDLGGLMIEWGAKVLVGTIK